MLGKFVPFQSQQTEHKSPPPPSLQIYLTVCTSFLAGGLGVSQLFSVKTDTNVIIFLFKTTALFKKRL